jgi:hypothetical protein
MKKYFVKKGLKRAACFVEAPKNIGTLEEDYLNGKWIEVSQSQAAFYAEHPYALFDEIMSMEIKNPPIPPTPIEISIENRYENLVVSKIRSKYTIDDELAIQRKRDVEANAFETYNTFCEQCKLEAKEELEIC